MEVLLEIGESKKVLTVTEDTLVRVVEEEMVVLGDAALLPFGFSSFDVPGASKEFYILQRWSDKWCAFVNVKKGTEVVAGDRLTIVQCPKGNSSKSRVSQTYRAKLAFHDVLSVPCCIFVAFKFIIVSRQTFFSYVHPRTCLY